MSPFTGWMKSCSVNCLTQDGRDVGRTGKLTMWCADPQKNLARLAARSSFTQIGSQRFADISGNGQTVVSLPFAPHQHLAAVPINILQSHGPPFSGPQAEPRQQEQNRVVALAFDRALVATV